MSRPERRPSNPFDPGCVAVLEAQQRPAEMPQGQHPTFHLVRPSSIQPVQSPCLSPLRVIYLLHQDPVTPNPSPNINPASTIFDIST